MRFLDYNGSSELDSQDIVTSVALDESSDDSPEDASKVDAHRFNAGCASALAALAHPALILLAAFAIVV